MRLGTVKLIKITAAHDVGKAINPLLVEGQVEGGIAQGIGMALMEEYIPGRTENLHDYLIPTIGDVPEIETILVEVADPEGPSGAKGLGEHVLIPTAPAILNAIRHATGVLVTTVPATPTRVLAAIRAGGGAAMSELAERFDTHDPGAAPGRREDPLRCLPGHVLHRRRPHRRLRPLRQSRRPHRAARPADHPRTCGSAGAAAGALRRRRRQLERPAGRQPPLRHGDRRRHHLSRLQAGAVHRQPGGRGRRSGDRRHRGHLQLLRRQGEDRHRPPSRPRDGDGAGARRGGRPCHDRRIRLADAVAGRRASPDRRLEIRRPRHLRDDARPLQPQAGRADDRGRRHASSSRPASRRSSTASRRSACASAAARRRSACSPRNGAGWSTRWWWSTTTSPASSPSIRPARCWDGRTPASRSSAAARRPAATSRSPSRASAGAARRSPIRWRSSATGTPRKARGPACRC